MKKAQSAIISTILLILIAIASASLILSFAIPFVNEQFSKTDCFELSGEVEITNSPVYTCYDSDNSELRVQVHFLKPGEIDGIAIDVGSSEAYKIYDGEVSAGVEMYGCGGILNSQEVEISPCEDTYAEDGDSTSNGDKDYAYVEKSDARHSVSLYKFDKSMIDGANVIEKADLCFGLRDSFDFQSSYPFYAYYFPDQSWNEDNCMSPSTCNLGNFDEMFQLEFGNTLTENSECHDIKDIFDLHKTDSMFSVMFNVSFPSGNYQSWLRFPTKETTDSSLQERVPYLDVTYGDSNPEDCSILELPGNNEQRTYKISIASKPDLIRVYPLLNENVCDSYSEQGVVEC